MTRVGIVILAAGSSKRFGDDDKLLAKVGGRALLLRVADAAVEARELLAERGIVTPIVCVVGKGHQARRGVLDGLGIGFVENPRADEGQSASIRAVLECSSAAITGEAGADAEGGPIGPKDWDGAAFLPGDLPFMRGGVVARVIGEFVTAGLDKVVVPEFQARAKQGPDNPGAVLRGNPVVWPKRFFKELIFINGDTGGRVILAGLPEEKILRLEFDESFPFLDVDTSDDLAAATRFLGRGNG